MPRLQVSATAVIAAPAERIFALLADPAADAQPVPAAQPARHREVAGPAGTYRHRIRAVTPRHSPQDLEHQ
jgi:uncharacterized protein YndB with AHSA1/START domain